MTVMCTSFSSRHDFLQLLQSINALEDMSESGLGRGEPDLLLLSTSHFSHCRLSGGDGTELYRNPPLPRVLYSQVPHCPILVPHCLILVPHCLILVQHCPILVLQVVIPPFSRYVVQDSADRGLELAEVLVTHLPIIVGHVQPLECLLATPSTTSGRQQSCACHMTRLSLHVHWSVLSVAYRLAPLVGRSVGP